MGFVPGLLVLIEWIPEFDLTRGVDTEYCVGCKTCTKVLCLVGGLSFCSFLNIGLRCGMNWNVFSLFLGTCLKGCKKSSFRGGSWKGGGCMSGTGEGKD